MREWQSQTHVEGKSAILFNQKNGRRKNVIGFQFRARGYCVSTVGLEEAVIRQYIRTQEEREVKEEQMGFDY